MLPINSSHVIAHISDEEVDMMKGFIAKLAKSTTFEDEAAKIFDYVRLFMRSLSVAQAKSFHEDLHSMTQKMLIEKMKNETPTFNQQFDEEDITDFMKSPPHAPIPDIHVGGLNLTSIVHDLVDARLRERGL